MARDLRGYALLLLGALLAWLAIILYGLLTTA